MDKAQKFCDLPLKSMQKSDKIALSETEPPPGRKKKQSEENEMAAKKAAKPEKTVMTPNVQEEKLKALEHALADLDKQFGPDAGRGAGRGRHSPGPDRGDLRAGILR